MILENNRVKLSLLTLDNYSFLTAIAQEKNLIYYSPSDISSPEKLKAYTQTAINQYDNKTAIPFIIYDKQKQSYAGSTRYGLIDNKNKVLHIGWTWLGKSFQGTELNKNCKFLMLQHAFETMQFEKVEFRVDQRNIKSRNAVISIGATLEGILRENVVMQNNYRRSSCCYGILKSEWHTIKNEKFKAYI